MRCPKVERNPKPKSEEFTVCGFVRVSEKVGLSQPALVRAKMSGVWERDFLNGEEGGQKSH